MLQCISNEEIEAKIHVPETWTLEKYSCLIQSVERHVKVVTKNEISVCGDFRPDGCVGAEQNSNFN